MSTENTTDTNIGNLEEVLRDPLSMSDEDLAALVGGQHAAISADDPSNEGAGADAAAGATPKGDTSGAAPGTGEEGKQQQELTAAASAVEGDDAAAGVQAKDGKHVIPYQVLAQERENRIRAEQMVRDLTAKLELDQAAAQQGKATKSADLSSIVDEQLLEQLREEAPEVAQRMDGLIAMVKDLRDQVDAGRPAAEEAETARREQQVQALVSIEDTIQANQKLAHLRATDPAAFNEVADIDSMLRSRAAWKDKPLSERFEAAVRMYEAERGTIELPSAAKAAPAQQPADEAARVAQAVAKAKESASGPSTLSDIPGGQPAAGSQADAMMALSGSALTDHFMNMSPDEIEAQLARLSS